MLRRHRAVRPATLTLGAVLAGLALTGLVAVAPFARFAYRSITVHAALESATALIAMLIAFLSYGRFRRTGAPRDLLMLAAFGLVAVADVFLALLPTLAGNGVPSVFAMWALLATRLAGALLLAGAGLVGADPRRCAACRRGLWAALLLIAATVAVLAAVRHSLPVPVDPTLSPEVSGRPRIAGNSAVLALQLVHLVPYAVAAWAFTRLADRDHDALSPWLAAGAALGACARLNYFLFPSIYSEWVYTGDLLRCASYVLFGVGVAREIQGYWASEVEVAVFAERRRMARDLHDGAVQEIGYVRSIAARMQHADPDAGRIVAAADRALGELRSALAALVAPVDEPVAAALGRAAGEVADRYDVALRLHVDPEITMGASVREELVRIVREAVGNAARHGHPSVVTITLARCVGGLELAVEDDGRGFDPQAPRREGFGLQGMRDRSRRLGGELVITSAPGSGARIEVTW